MTESEQAPKKKYNPIVHFRCPPRLLGRLDTYRDPLGLSRTSAIILALDKGLKQLSK